MAIIRWTTTNPGGTDLHYGIVHYGTDAMNLSQVAKSPNRRNPSHADMIFRVRIARLNPQTTYYYTVESTGATGVNDGVSSHIRTFKTSSPTFVGAVGIERTSYRIRLVPSMRCSHSPAPTGTNGTDVRRSLPWARTDRLQQLHSFLWLLCVFSNLGNLFFAQR